MTELSIREKTARLRRQHILDAAITVFATRGFHRATIRDIAVEAGVSDGTIYNVFENKAALLTSMLDPLGEAEGPPAAVSGPAPHDVKDLIGEMMRRRWATYTPQTLAILRIVLSEALINEDLRTAYLDQVIATGLGLPQSLFESLVAENRIAGADVPLVLRTMAGALLGIVLLRLLGEQTTEARWNDFPEQIARLFLDGLLPRAEGECHAAP